MLMPRATLADLHALLDSRGQLPLHRGCYSVLVAQIVVGEAYAIYETAAARAPALLAGIAPLGNGAGEMWFGVQPGGLGRLMLPVVRRMREVIKSRSAAYPGGLCCLVRPGHSPGETLARLLGCGPTGVMLGDQQEWVWTDEHDGRGRGAAAGEDAA